MIKRIDLLMPPENQTGGHLSILTEELYRAFVRKGVKCRLLTPQKENPEPFLKAIFDNPPECTFSLNGLLPDSKGNFFCDLIKIPHVACLIDTSTTLYLSLAKSPLTVITCPDLNMQDFFKGLNAEHVHFMPPGIDKEIQFEPAERTLDVVFFGSCIDYDKIRSDWNKKYGPQVAKALESAAEIALNHSEKALVEALVEGINDQQVDPTQLDILSLLDELEAYLKGKDRVELIRGITEAPISIFGAGPWKKYAGNNVTVHEALPFAEARQLMRQAKIVLKSSPTIRNGLHGGLLNVLAAEALCVTNENPYLKKHFKDEILFYHPSRIKELNDKINAYLFDEKKRSEIASHGKIKAMAEHTWDQRVDQLLKQLTLP